MCDSRISVNGAFSSPLSLAEVHGFEISEDYKIPEFSEYVTNGMPEDKKSDEIAWLESETLKNRDFETSSIEALDLIVSILMQIEVQNTPLRLLKTWEKAVLLVSARVAREH